MKTPPTTGTARRALISSLSRLLEQGADHVISIHTSSQLSAGFLNAAHTAAQEFPEQVHVQDSQNVSMGLDFRS